MEVDDLHISMILDVFDKVSEQYVKIQTSDFLKIFRSNERNKNTALRCGIKQKEGKRKNLQEKTNPPEEQLQYICGVCGLPCTDNPASEAELSIGCDSCEEWYHYPCIGLTGSEPFLSRKRMS